MKLIAHRGWSAGKGENSLEAFARAADEPAVAGVEFDVRHGPDGPVVSHDPPGPGAPSLAAVLEALAPTGLDLWIEVKEPGLGGPIAGALARHGLGGRATLFGFPFAARSLPWEDRGDLRLGVIAVQPWRVPALVRAHRPDVILLGWDERAWTRLAFRAWWTAFPLRRLGPRHSAAVVAGIVGRPGDLDWLRRQGVDAAVADLDAHPGLLRRERG